MPLAYHPGVVDQSGQIVAEGMRNRNQQLMQIASMLVGMQEKKQDKLDQGVKARSALKALGVENADHMSAQEALGVASVIPEVVAKQKQAQMDKAQSGFLQSFSDRSAPVSGPAQDPRAATLGALAGNPGSENTPIGRDAFSRVMTPPRQTTPLILPNVGGTGANVMVDPNTGRPTQLRPAPGSTPPPQKNVPPALDDGEQWEQVKTAGGKPIPGLYHSTKDGQRTGKQWYDPQSQPRGTSLFDSASGAPDETPTIPTVGTQDAYDALESGAQYYDATGNLRQKK